MRRRAILSLALLAAPAWALDAPNVVVVSERLVTAGQPSAAALAGLRSAGFDAVVYLAPGTVHGAVPDERSIVETQGMRFIHIPIPFGSPTAEHAAAVTSALQRLGDAKVLVHCEVNMRASTMVFLHRVIARREDPAQAYAAVSAVWSPRGPWRTLIEDQLRANGIRFELL